MGLSASKQVNSSLSNSNEFNSACDSAYSHCLSLTQHAFEGVLPYQLLTASNHIHHGLLSLPHPPPLVVKWVPHPPSQAQVDLAFKRVSRCHSRRSKEEEEEEEEKEEKPEVIGSNRFKEWAVVLYASAVVGNAGKALLSRVPIGVAGIAGIGAVTGSRKDLVGAAIGVYALGVATSIYLSLSG
ncbi:hypothetical protein WN943_016100 [Citrus x changshan-huyou]